jgi:hypothetical protein
MRSAAKSPRHAPRGDREIPVDRFLGREVRAVNNRRMGRLEEIRVEPRGREYVVTEYVIGAAGLLERLGVGFRLLFGRKTSGYVARWDQLDVSDPRHPRLLCEVGELRRL